ncbi:TOMM precursor leader peptide-binding protein [Nonomuraea sp. SYSU D8015]|uniref:TOMM precursor leader peptide-binding protein n=1 Tax=Nonomuraea sp. SYSU D8015 TaxID=2593644 RepID=UPI00166181A9|nr:TOMM precursor leader peptide-binding protein [Nonomuraea sp. SYSU D8015]
MTVDRLLSQAIQADESLEILIADDPTAEDIAIAAARRGLPVLVVRAALGQVTIGPLVAPGKPGCDTCRRRREETALAAAPEGERDLFGAVSSGALRPTPPPLTAATLEAVAALVAGECAALRDGAAPRTSQAVMELDTRTLAVRRRRFLPDPLCPDCGIFPDNTPADGMLDLAPSPKLSPTSYRVRDLIAERERLMDVYVDSKYGVIPRVPSGEAGPMAIAQALAGRPGFLSAADGYGRSPSHTASAVVAIAEALERMGGLNPRARKVSVHASFDELGPERALDPVRLGLPDWPPADSGYRSDLELGWVYAYSFARGGPLLVPANVAYYGEGGERFVFECSNGCALGGSLAEAILYGIFEIAERDAFLITWYARLPLPRIDPRTSADPVNRLLASWIESDSLCRLHVFDATMPEGLPAVMVALVDEEDRPGVPKAYFSAGAHLDPDRALRGGLSELASAYRDAADELRSDPERAEKVAADPELVRTMEDHMVAYASPLAWPRLEFLFTGSDMRHMAEAFPPDALHQPADDLRTDLRQVVDRYLTEGLDVLVVDQTSSEHRAADLHCVKVIIPGTLPMTFGHRHRRARAFTRLRTAPVRLGYRSEPLPEAEINAYPHPFP